MDRYIIIVLIPSDARTNCSIVCALVLMKNHISYDRKAHAAYKL